MQERYEEGLSPDELMEMDERRLQKMNDAGINQESVISSAQNNTTIWQNYFSENITRGKDDMNFVLRDQWTAVERSEFNRLFKLAMTFNKIYPEVKKIAGEQRKNKPDLMVRSLTGRASQEQIDLRADLCRTISYKSQNDLVYQTAFMSAMLMGYGAFRIDIEYTTPKSWTQEIVYKLIKDPTLTSFDPCADKPHKGDGNFCSQQHIFGKEEFFATFPYITNPVSWADPRSLLDFQWETRDTIIICDYYVKEWYSTIIYKLSNGLSVNAQEWEEMQRSFKKMQEITSGSFVVGDMLRNEMPRVVAERQTQDYKIMHYRLLQNQIIDFAEWPSKYLPIIFVDGDSNFIEGRQYTHSIVHDAKDAQKCVNFFGSEIATEVKNRRREQWIGTPDNILGQEQIWRNPELQNGILIARPDPKTGQMPQKLPPWDMSPALMQNFVRSSQDIREILGFNEAAEQSRDISGSAKRERKLDVSMASYVFFDNLNQSVEQSGRVVNDLLYPVMGAEQRHVTITQKNGDTRSLILNRQKPDGTFENKLEDGDFDIEIDTGPSFAVQQQIALEFLQQTLQANPQAFPLVADLWAGNLDVQFREQMVSRFETMVPPQILAKEKGTPPPPPQPNPQEVMMKQQMQMNEQKMQLEQDALQERAEELKIRKERHRLEAQEMAENARLRREQHKLDQIEMLLKAKEAAERNETEKTGHVIDVHRIDLEYSSKIAKLLADLKSGESDNKDKK